MNPVIRVRAAPKSGGFTLLELAIALAVIMVVSAGVFLAFRQPDRRNLDNAALQLQADIRYAHRRTISSGQRYRVYFSRINNYYRIRPVGPGDEILRVYLQNGVQIHANQNFLEFLPRGTSTAAVTITLTNGRYRRQLTSTVAGARIELRDTETAITQ